MTWTEHAERIARGRGDPAQVSAALDHAIFGLFCAPVEDLLGAAPARIAVGLAIVELGDGPSPPPGPDDGAVHTGDVIALLRWAETELAAGPDDVDVALARARAALYVREALAALFDG